MSDDDGKLKPVRLIFQSGEETPPAPAEAPPTAPPPPDDDGRELPPQCPVKPLGIADDVYYYLDDACQLRELKARDHSRLGVLSLFNSHFPMLYEFWPRKNSEGVTTGWRPERASEELMAAAAKCGVWNPFNRTRGRGAWRGDDGQLILHCGDAVLDGATWRSPGAIGRDVFPRREAVIRPVDRRVGGDVAAELLTMLGSWNWRRGQLDARLLLGWIGAAMLAGALQWRPVAWITGGKSTGKSTLHEALKGIFDVALLSVSDPSAASVWQSLGYDTLPVALDEAEAEEDNRKQQALLRLARQAASGGIVLRGGADHTAQKFVARSCFLFSSIRLPPLLGQDRSRIAVLALGELAGEKPPDLAPARLRLMGQKLLRRLVDGWARLPQALEQYRAALVAHGHKSRTIDVFGTLLACADLLLTDDDVDSDSAGELAELLDIAALPEADDDASDQQRWLNFLMTCVIPLDGAGTKNTVAEWIRQATVDHNSLDVAEANRILGNYGMKVLRLKLADGNQAPLFAIANQHTGLDRLHAGTHWAGRSGTMGVWVQAARDIDGAEKYGTLRFNSAPVKCTVIPLGQVLPKPAAHEAEAPSHAQLPV